MPQKSPQSDVLNLSSNAADRAEQTRTHALALPPPPPPSPQPPAADYGRLAEGGLQPATALGSPVVGTDQGSQRVGIPFAYLHSGGGMGGEGCTFEYIVNNTA